MMERQITRKIRGRATYRPGFRDAGKHNRITRRLIRAAMKQQHHKEMDE